MTVLELGAHAKSAVSTLAVVGVQGTVLALVALAITRAGRLRPSWQAAMWLVVLAKFALPWGPAMPWSLADLIALLRGTSDAGAPIMLSPDAPIVATATAIGPSIGWIALASIWTLGTIYFASRAIRASINAHRIARVATPITVPIMLPRRVRVVAGEASTGPFVVGILRPIIVIPPALLDEPQLLRATLLHEIAHIRRHDGIARIVQLVATSIFFFWPVVRLANRKLDFAREAACDAYALAAIDLPRTAYARLLVQMARLQSPALALAATRNSALQARVDAILAARTRHGFGAVHALGLVAWVVLSLGGARTAAARGEPVCNYSTRMAETLRVLHPEADTDGDGMVTRTEACEFQAELRRRATDEEMVSRMPIDEQELLSEPICCNCDSTAGQPAWSSSAGDQPSCQQGLSTP